ncbi:MAG: GTPase Era [Verrucomicrobiota bacterium]
MDGEVEFKEGRVGFVTILGRPNVGKSTFVNKALGYHLAAVSRRPNTTRKKWLGILSDGESQIILVDTPGVHESRNKMQEAMAGTIKTCLEDNDATVCLCDATRAFGEEDERVAAAAASSGKPRFLLINKVDVAREGQVAEMKKRYLDVLKEVEVFEISAQEGVGVKEALQAVKASLPEGPFMYPEDQLTDVIERDVAEEVIREAANELVYQEVPQSLTVKIDTWKENEKKVRIFATVYLEREAQKPIVIGESGKMINAIAKSAREKLRVDLEKFVDVKLSVKVTSDWQNKKRFLKEMGIVDTTH